MSRLGFKDLKSFVHLIQETYDNIIQVDEYYDIDIIARYKEAKEIIQELILSGFKVTNLWIECKEINNYDSEYIISLCSIEDKKELWCEPMKRNNHYTMSTSNIIYIMENCSSNVIPYCKGDVVYEVSVSDEECDLNDECCECDKNENTESPVDSNNNNGCSIAVRCNLDADEVTKVIKDMENRMERMNDMFREMDSFRRLFNW